MLFKCTCYTVSAGRWNVVDQHEVFSLSEILVFTFLGIHGWGRSDNERHFGWPLFPHKKFYKSPVTNVKRQRKRNYKQDDIFVFSMNYGEWIHLLGKCVCYNFFASLTSRNFVAGNEFVVWVLAHRKANRMSKTISTPFERME